MSWKGALEDIITSKELKHVNTRPIKKFDGFIRYGITYSASSCISNYGIRSLFIQGS